MYVGQDAYAEAQQYGTFGLSVDVTGTPDTLPWLPSPIPGLMPSPAIPDVSPATTPFPWWLLIAAVLILALAQDSRR